MKVPKQKTRVEVEGVTTKAFTIKFDRGMVNILSNQLYEDKVRALVRELSTNALDSQTEAGFTGQFEVHLPNWSDMSFWIRDYGTGMTPEKIMNVYTEYGNSDRSDSNDFTGCMGLGSKTPFCYHTKTFNVDSWCDGMHYQYSCFLDEDGMPQIAPMSEEPSDEPTGVKVTLNTASGDRYEFAEAAQSIYKYFAVTPKILGNSVDIEKVEYELEDDDWKYVGDYGEEMRIIMGNVAYRVSEEALGDLTKAQRKVVEAGFHVTVDIGEVGVTASREGLDYTSRTKTHVRRYINKIVESFNRKAQIEIDKCKNLWDARIKFAEYENDSLRGIFDASKILYDGKPLTNADGYVDWRQMIKDDKVDANQFMYSTWRKPERKNINCLSIGKSPAFYRNDLKVGGFVRSTWQSQQLGRDIILVTFKTPTAEAEFCELMGFDSSYFTDISIIPSPTIRQGGPRRGKSTKVQLFKGLRERHYKSHYWENVEVDIADGGVFIEINRFSVGLHGKIESPSSLYRLVNALRDMKIKLPNIYGIKTAHLKAFNKDSNWTNFFEWAVTQVADKVAGKDLTSKQIYKRALDKVGSARYNSGKLETTMIHKIAGYCDATSELALYSAEIKRVEALAKGVDDVRYLRRGCEVFGVEVPVSTATAPDLKGREAALYEHYKLLTVMTDCRNSKICLEHIGLYVNAVDNII